MKSIVFALMVISVFSNGYAKTFTSKGLNNNFSNGLLLAQNEDVDLQSQIEEPYPTEQQDPQEYQDPQMEEQPVPSDNSVENDA